jgi:hypothetical protein
MHGDHVVGLEHDLRQRGPVVVEVQQPFEPDVDQAGSAVAAGGPSHELDHGGGGEAGRPADAVFEALGMVTAVGLVLPDLRRVGAGEREWPPEPRVGGLAPAGRACGRRGVEPEPFPLPRVGRQVGRNARRVIDAGPVDRLAVGVELAQGGTHRELLVGLTA